MESKDKEYIPEFCIAPPFLDDPCEYPNCSCKPKPKEDLISRSSVIAELEQMKITGLGKDYNDVSALIRANETNALLNLAIKRIQNLK